MKVTERVQQDPDALVFLCDLSPPRGSADAAVASARGLDADYICVAYNPGRAVRVDSAAMAWAIKHRAGRDVLFNLATRDMNKIAIQSHLLGAWTLELENVVVLAGDPLSQRDQTMTSHVGDYHPTSLIEALALMNQGTDFRGSSLREATDFCIGASIDLSRGAEAEARLALRKADAGAHFFVTQPVFHRDEITGFMQHYRRVAGKELDQPVFWGVQVLQQDGVVFSTVPEGVRRQLEGGRPGTEIALELLGQLVDAGIRDIYLVPPILRGGTRNYKAAQEVLSKARALA